MRLSGRNFRIALLTFVAAALVVILEVGGTGLAADWRRGASYA